MGAQKTTITILALAAATLLQTSCEFCNYGYWQAGANRSNLKGLRVGMTKMEVVSVMGEPLKNETFNKPDIWFYYTELKWSDTYTSRDECTPLVFAEGKLQGWGEDYYKRTIQFKPIEKKDKKSKYEDNEGDLEVLKPLRQDMDRDIFTDNIEGVNELLKESESAIRRAQPADERMRDAERDMKSALEVPPPSKKAKPAKKKSEDELPQVEPAQQPQAPKKPSKDEEKMSVKDILEKEISEDPMPKKN